jgi:hypothetical protein
MGNLQLFVIDLNPAMTAAEAIDVRLGPPDN